jgi:hypothetical protein
MTECRGVMRPHGDHVQIHRRMARKIVQQPAQVGVIGAGGSYNRDFSF